MPPGWEWRTIITHAGQTGASQKGACHLLPCRLVLQSVQAPFFNQCRFRRSSIPKGLHHVAQGWPDSERDYPGFWYLYVTTLQGLNPSRKYLLFNSFRVVFLTVFAQGSSFLATLGWMLQSLWDCPRLSQPHLLAPAVNGSDVYCQNLRRLGDAGGAFQD